MTDEMKADMKDYPSTPWAIQIAPLGDGGGVITDDPVLLTGIKKVIEEMAIALHEAGREAVRAGQTVNFEQTGNKATRFLEWEDISENVREGRRQQARWLIAHYGNSESEVTQFVLNGFLS